MRSHLALGLLAVSLALLAGCKKDHDPCGTYHAPDLNYNSWPIWLEWDSVLPVMRDYIPVDLYAEGDIDQKEEITVTAISIRIQADANDSLIYAEDRQPGTAIATVSEVLHLDSISVAIPATIRVVATNSCGHTGEQLRHLLITPH